MSLSPLVGLGLRSPHYQQVLSELPPIGWLEIHSENFFRQGGAGLNYLRLIAKHYPISLHGVGLSLGSVDGFRESHLNRLSSLANMIEPCFISDHLSWGRVNTVHLPDLLPLPLTAESLEVVCRNVESVQSVLNRALLIENPSSYLEYEDSTYSEVDFMIEVCRRTGAKILLDLNNVYVSAVNHGWNAIDYVDKIPAELVKEIHLAGHASKVMSNGQRLLVDTHDNVVSRQVWELFDHTIARIGPTPTLIEWDTKLPALEVLMEELSKVSTYLARDRVDAVFS